MPTWATSSKLDFAISRCSAFVYWWSTASETQLAKAGFRLFGILPAYHSFRRINGDPMPATLAQIVIASKSENSQEELRHLFRLSGGLPDLLGDLWIAHIRAKLQRQPGEMPSQVHYPI